MYNEKQYNKLNETDKVNYIKTLFDEVIRKYKNIKIENFEKFKGIKVTFEQIQESNIIKDSEYLKKQISYCEKNITKINETSNGDLTEDLNSQIFAWIGYISTLSKNDINFRNYKKLL